MTAVQRLYGFISVTIARTKDVGRITEVAESGVLVKTIFYGNSHLALQLITPKRERTQTSITELM